MPGQAIITLNENQWTVSIASTYAELTTGLRGVASLAVGTGMLFILPAAQAVSVDTSGMNFALDIIFIANNIVIDVARNVEPGYLVTEETPGDSFLEVNAGEAVDVEAGDSVSTATIQQPGTDFSQIISFAVPLALLGFVCAMAGGMMTGVVGSSSPPKLLLNSPKPKPTGKVTVKCPICEKEIEVVGYDRVTRSEALEKHIEEKHKIGERHSITKLELRRLLERKFEDAKPRPSTKLALEFISKEERERYGSVADWWSWGVYIPRADAVALTFWDKPYYSDKEKEELLQTLAHELGHAIVQREEYPETKEERQETELKANIEMGKLLRRWGIPERGSGQREQVTEYRGYKIKEYGHPDGTTDWWVTNPEGQFVRVCFSAREAKEVVDEELAEHHSMWLTLEQRKELEKKYGSVAVRWAEEATKPSDIKGVEAAAEYYYKKIREAFGLGHLSPELSEEQLKKLREVLELPKEVPPREKGYID
jgi:uncharacterized membrane protein (UPF0127 family)